jgi:hypothetical protein
VSVALHQGVGTINPAATSTTIATLVSVALHWGRVFFFVRPQTRVNRAHGGRRLAPTGGGGWNKTDGERHGPFDIENLIFDFRMINTGSSSPVTWSTSDASGQEPT